MVLSRGEITIAEVHDGVPEKLFRAWSNSSDGKKDFSKTESEGRSYLGTNVGLEEPTHYSEYDWTKIKGDDGEDGEDGVSIVAIQAQFATSSSDSKPPSSGWSSSQPSREDGVYIWRRDMIVFSDNETTYTTPVVVTGDKGDSGKDTYTWIKYADEEDGSGISSNPEGKVYIGFAYNKDTPTESDNPKDYTWSAMYDLDVIKDISLRDKTEILSGNPIYTDKADDESVVHVEMDGKTKHQVPVGEGRNVLKGSSVEQESDSGGGDVSNIYYKLLTKIKIGETYTLSYDVKTSDENDKYYIWLRRKDSSGMQPIIGAGSAVKAKTTYSRHTITFEANNNSAGESTNLTFTNRVHNVSGNKGYLYIKNVKLEKGSTATPYSPAPEDVENNLQSVNNVDIVSQETTISGESSVDKIKVSGRNLFVGSNHLVDNLNSDNKIILGDKIYGAVGYEWFYSFTKSLKKGTYTISVPVYNPNDVRSQGRINLQTQNTGHYSWIMPKEEKILSYTFIINEFHEDYRFHILTQSSSETLYFGYAKLEKGDIATPWTPAPEDVPYDTLENNLYKTKLELEEPLRSVGDVKDRLFRDEDGLWKVEWKLHETIFDGSEAWNRWYDRETSAVFGIGPHNLNILPRRSGEVVSNIFGNKGDNTNDTEGILLGSNPRIRIRANYSRIRTNKDESKESMIESFKNWVEKQKNAGNPLTVIYELEEPYTETLSNTLQNKLNNIASFSKGNSVYTILPDKSDILQSKLQPELHATFKSKGWYRNFVTERKIIEVDLSSKEAIKSDINQLKSEKRRIDAQYTVVYDNEDLSEEVKPKLYDAKRALNGAYDILIANMVKVAEVAAGVTPSDKDREAVQSAFNDYSDKIDKYEGMIQNAIDSISGTRFETVDGELAKVEKRVTTAESKITDDAIRNTVTSHTTFKNVQKDAEKAKNTLDSKSKTWDGKAETSYVDSKANSAETSAKNYTDKELSPVIDRVKTAEQKITDDAIRSTVTSHSTFQNVKKTADDAKKTLDSKSKSWDGKAEPSYVDSKASSAESSAKSHADNKASSAERNAKNYADDALSPVIERVETAESKITKNAIVNTVRESTKYIDDLTGKVSTNEIISRINQTAEKISIDAKKIDLNGAVTISSFGSGLKNDFNAKASKSEAQNYASNAENSAKSYVDDLEIGGRNIIKKSNDFRAGRGDAGITSRITSKGYLEVKNTSSDSNWFTEFLKTNSGIEDSFSEGEVFTISLTMKSPDHIKIPTIYLKNGMGYYELKGEMKKEFSTFYYTGKWKKGSELSFHFGFSGVVGTTIVKDIKLEKGTKATDWTPAPEDVDERVSSVEGSINNAVTTIDGDGVTVKDGSFFLEDDKSDTRYSILQGANLLQDHSFELTKYQLSGSAPRFDSKGYFYAEPSKNAPANWANTGTPRLFPGLGGSLRQHPRMFGRMAGVVNSTNYFYQWVEMPDVSGASIYTLSAYFRTSAHSSSGTPRFRVRVGDGDSNKWSGWETRNFSTVNDNSGMVRHSLTFDYEAMRRASGTSYGGHIEVQIMSASANWIMVDGVQLIEGHYPMNYNPEESLFNFMNGVNGTIGSEIVTEGLRVIGEQNIVRSGSNSNGRWIQFADGTMICTIEITRRANSSLARGAVYVEVDPYIWTFPARFYSSPVVSLNSKVWALLGGYVGDSDNSSSRHRVITHNSSTNVNATYSLIAIGRWE